ncbi:hypothetical protein C6V05_18070 [Burkholderia multivorans]|nr:hypothetical protein C6V05_18070 [Burkholderia multivorans]
MATGEGRPAKGASQKIKIVEQPATRDNRTDCQPALRDPPTAPHQPRTAPASSAHASSSTGSAAFASRYAFGDTPTRARNRRAK